MKISRAFCALLVLSALAGLLACSVPAAPSPPEFAGNWIDGSSSLIVRATAQSFYGELHSMSIISFTLSITSDDVTANHIRGTVTSTTSGTGMSLGDIVSITYLLADAGGTPQLSYSLSLSNTSYPATGTTYGPMNKQP
jgi:hypothetical protein